MKMLKQKKRTKELVINFHMTEACNYRCDYCYAHWNDDVNQGELHSNEGSVNELLCKLADHFFSANPIKAALGYDSVRLNFAGGEPIMLGDRFVRALLFAKSLGFRTSIITNGHFLTQPVLHQIADKLDVLGISIDTADELLAMSIGRQDRKGNWLTPARARQIANTYRQLNPTGKLKINTVVNHHNYGDSMVSLISELKPNKWKVLRVLPVHCATRPISDEDYADYLLRHRKHAAIMVPEDNTDMWQSYLMINPHGRFYQNQGAGEGLVESDVITRVGVEKALAQVDFNLAAFVGRYQQPADADVVEELV